MQLFEFHFNPKIKEDYFFDSFVYEPENAYERKLGSLYLAGDLRNALPQNSKLLDNLAQVIKKNYYSFGGQPLQMGSAPIEKALSESLKKTNDFLAEEVKKENVSWLGNLNFAVLSIKDLNLTFTKTGNLKILLIRGGQIIDVGKNLNLQEIEPYPLKIFFNVVSGKLIQNDIILVLTKEVFDFFVQQNILDKISQAEGLNKTKLKEILPSHLFTKKKGPKISGICFLAILKEKTIKEKEFLRQGYGERIKEVIFQEKERFSFSSNLLSFVKKNLSGQIFLPLFRPFQKIKKIRLPRPQNPLKLLKNKIRKPKINLPRPILIKNQIKSIKKKVILIIVLISLLSLGFLIFKEAGERKQKKIEISLDKIQEKFDRAEGFLIFKEEQKANALFKEVWLEISNLPEKSISTDITDLKQSVEEELRNLNKLEEIENPQEASEPEKEKLFTPLAPPENLTPPAESDFSFDLSASYLSNLYFLDKKTCKIIKYSSSGQSTWGLPKTWKESDEHCSEPKSMAIDSSIWILNKDNSISRYHQGEYQETINLDLFPSLENITKIKVKTNIPYLYLLEPANKRVIITDRNGKIVRQFQSEKFNNLKDFTVSDDGKTIWLLNDQKVYQIELQTLN